MTEAITGVDLVEWQLRVALGRGASLFAGRIFAISGHAFEARLYAEDVPKGFLPATGRLTHLRFAEGCRADTGVRAGDEGSRPGYDPDDRQADRAWPDAGGLRCASWNRRWRARRWRGSVTNLAFLRRLAGHAGFAAGDVDTGLIGRDLDTLAAAPVPCSRTQDAGGDGRFGPDGGGRAGGGVHAVWSPLRRSVVLAPRGGDDRSGRGGGAGRAGRRCGWVDAPARGLARDAGRWRVDGAPVAAEVVVIGPAVSVFVGRRLRVRGGRFRLRSLRRPAAAGDWSWRRCRGLVKAVFVKPGDAVAAGDRLPVLRGDEDGAFP